MKIVNIILEKGESGDLFGRVSSPSGIDPGFMLTTVGATVAEVTSNLRDLIQDFIEHEGKGSEYWEKVNVNEIEFEYEYDLTALFQTFQELNITKIAERAGINASLLRQYVSSIKHPSVEQAKKIETAIHNLAKELLEIHVTA